MKTTKISAERRTNPMIQKFDCNSRSVAIFTSKVGVFTFSRIFTFWTSLAEGQGGEWDGLHVE